MILLLQRKLRYIFAILTILVFIWMTREIQILHGNAKSFRRFITTAATPVGNIRSIPKVSHGSAISFRHSITTKATPRGNIRSIPEVLVHPAAGTSRKFLVILIATAPSNLQHRNVIRRTWGRPSNWHIKTINYTSVFLLGKSNINRTMIELEILHHKDLLIGDFEDVYANLVSKVLMGLAWASSIDCEYVFKADDDVYVNVPRLLDWLGSPYSRLPRDLYAGFVHDAIVPRRENTSKHYIGDIDYRRQKYRPYCSGPFYVMSQRILPRLTNASLVVPAFRIEDAYIGLLAYHIGVLPYDQHGFHLLRNSKKEMEQFSPCDLLTTIACGHAIQPNYLEKLHAKFLSLESKGNTVFLCVSYSLEVLGRNMGYVVISLLFLISLGSCACHVVSRCCCHKTQRRPK